jgi:hypothetical protein
MFDTGTGTSQRRNYLDTMCAIQRLGLWLLFVRERERRNSGSSRGCVTSNHTGRRKGDTAEKRHTDKTRFTLAKNACVNRMVQLRGGLTTKAKVSAGEYQKIAREVEEEFGWDKGEMNP